MSLPFLPGNTFNDPCRQSYARSQTLQYNNGYAVPATLGTTPAAMGLDDDALESYAGSDPMLTYGADFAATRKAAQVQPFVPAYVKLDKVVLRFGAYFQEAVPESPDETYRVRRVTLSVFVEDDSVQIDEAKTPNSGLVQGVLLKRQLVPKPDGSLYTLDDFNVGLLVPIYGRTYKITSADDYTRKFLAERGVAVADDLPQPRNPYDDKRAAAAALVHTHTPDIENDKLAKFLAHDRQVLRFFCVWDDRDKYSKQLRPFNVHFFLADDTVEVREVRTNNDGRDPFPLLLNRNKLPIHHDKLPAPGDPPPAFYNARDFFIGMTLNVFGRPFLVYDCDGFTRKFYADVFGRAMEPITLTQSAPPPPVVEVPPHTGFGTQADSLGSVNRLAPAPPRRDYVKLAKNEGKVLRFEASMITTATVDLNRKFIVSYFLADDTMSVFEPPVRNSGILGGKFLDRTRCTYPGTDTVYEPQDLYIGATVDLYGHKFVLTNADEYALSYMEQRPHLYPRANIQLIKAKLASGLDDFVNAATIHASASPDGLVSADEFQDACFATGVPDLVGHEVLSLMRAIDSDASGRFDIMALVDELSASSSRAD
ncbi:uncharacterized protein AMSG_03474 [Thecamonas trahens ATCC 50062]|uniref:DM10 domain-containing protein n=1 Tax=Thecamonas trahens ATCC 50062 TaxID=461836 RepID=A0A0L0D3Z3_THETB|nr:hypothetical protein AMSG_03474 [Thecamonas trahens ATCC 50062]KNC47049.1 hypothetical protein AMSG_03474 [Thecamonas trahens ATCC 50062]|eukprot:XP_013759829.1 hypothetical protein AMSG_03474 [Thecamonas trahens ATCC 50062]